MDPTTAVFLTLFPTSDHREVGVGPYAFEAANAPLIVDGLPQAMPPGLEIMTRRIYDSEEALYDEDGWAAGQGMHVRFYRDADGQVVLDRFELESLALNVRIRPELGDELDIGMFMGSWERVWHFGDTGRAQWRVYSPMNVTLLGLARTDMASDDKLKYYASAGTGIGGEVLTRVVGPVGIQARAEVQASARRRRGDGVDHFTTRQEITTSAELGIMFIDGQRAFVVGSWAEHVSQWEPWDQGGRDGINRSYFAAGARISGRFYKEREYLPLPDLDGVVNGPIPDLDIDSLLESIREDPLRDRDGGAAAGGQEEADGVLQGGGGRLPHMPLEVNWSEVEVLNMVDPLWPDGTQDGVSCSMVFFVDTTGVPYDVRPDKCDALLLPAVMEAAWGWRFRPVVEEGDTVSATFLYTITKGQIRQDGP